SRAGEVVLPVSGVAEPPPSRRGAGTARARGGASGRETARTPRPVGSGGAGGHRRDGVRTAHRRELQRTTRRTRGSVTGALTVEHEPVAELPPYVPARMVNEFVYCPRFFHLAWVSGESGENEL